MESIISLFFAVPVPPLLAVQYAFPERILNNRTLWQNIDGSFCPNFCRQESLQFVDIYSVIVDLLIGKSNGPSMANGLVALPYGLMSGDVQLLFYNVLPTGHAQFFRLM